MAHINANAARPPQSLECQPMLLQMSAQAKQAITFCHPGYKEPNTLLTLSGFDSCDGHLHHETARVACAIIANNRFDGYLSETANGSRLSLGPDDLLSGRRYYFIVPGFSTHSTSYLPPPLQAPSTHALPPQTPYPIVPSFSTWRFPHQTLPPSWAALPAAEKGTKSNYTTAVRCRDKTCRMTECADQCEVAHICPVKQGAWFSSNKMEQYTAKGRGRPDTNDLSNLVLLRRDLHAAFDQHDFVFVPKYGVLCTHLLGDSDQYRRLYHNTTLHPTALGPELLLARFALAILSGAGSLSTNPAGTWVAVRVEGEDKVAKMEPSDIVDMIKADRGRSSRNPSPTKCESPTKRKRDDDLGDCDKDVNNDEETGARTNENDGLGGQERRYYVGGTKLGSLDRDERCRPPGKRRRYTSHSSCSTATLSQPPSTSSLHDRDLAAICDAALAKERARSDPHNAYLKEREWAYSVLDNGGRFEKPCQATYDRFYRAMGAEMADEEGD